MISTPNRLSLWTNMSKRSVPEIEAELQEAKRQAKQKAYESAALSTLDPLMKKMGEQLAPYYNRREGGWILKLYPPAGCQWRYHELYDIASSFYMKTPWSMQHYFESRSRRWDDPLVYRADSREELIPEGADLLRLFGVLFFIHETSLQWEPVEPDCVNLADPWLPLASNKFVRGGVHDLTDPATVSRLFNRMLCLEEIAQTLGRDEMSELRRQKEELQRKLDAMEAMTAVVYEQVYPYSHAGMPS